ncbi:PAS domain-containing sensor histidine kinase [Pedobacter sp.]|uniref:PAS domain-containing sensor histidine kinase n=1 Tax=Pedobacter sp. TaxID=1411316 RepID=UPI003C5F0530
MCTNSHDCIISKTLDGVIMSWNPSAEKMFGYNESEVIGKHISLIIPPDRLEEETFIISQIRAGKKVEHFETERLTKSGKLIPISVTVSPVITEDGEIIGASKIARDISERILLQQEKSHLYDQLKTLSDRQNEFIGLASHELKTPLTSLNGYLQILEKTNEGQNSGHIINKAIHQVQKLARLIDDLLDITKIHTGKLAMSLKPVELKEIVKAGIELLQHAYPDHVFTFKTDIEAVRVEVDAQRIEQVLTNLLTNAVRYSPSSNLVEIFLDVDHKQAIVSVRDQGLGIPEDKLEIIFSRFYRMEDRPGPGLGLGLFLCNEIVQLHGGRIWAESTLSKGSIFRFSLPLMNVQPEL